MIEFVLGGMQFPMTPEKVTVTEGAQVKSWDLLDLGEVMFPRGRQATRVSFSFTLPGSSRQGQPFVSAWQDPATFAAQLSRWLQNGTTLSFVATDTGISLSVFIQSLTTSAQGGHGDLEGQITLCEQRTLAISTTTPTTSGGTPINPYRAQVNRSVPNTPATYTVRPGDTLWSIAKVQLGDGSLSQQLYRANVGTVGPDAGAALPPGTQLVLPGGS